MILPEGTRLSRSALAPRTLERFERCRASAVLSSNERDVPTPAQWWGILVHLFIKHAATKGRDYALDYARRKFKRGLKCVSAIDVDQIPVGEHELALAHNPFARTARQLMGGQKADGRVELYSRADVIQYDPMMFEEEPAVIDFKCGDEPPDPCTPQLLAIACAVRDETSWKGPVRLVTTAVRSTGELVPREHLATVEELDAFNRRLLEVLLQANADRVWARDLEELPAFTPGDHCAHCPLRGKCPATKERAHV